MARDELGTRMKSYYEQIPKTRLMRRTPVIIRVDGKAFHTFTRGFGVPFDDVLIKSMQETAKYLCEKIQGCYLAYTQSDEISLLLLDYERFETAAWFDYEVQKMCSVSASMTTMAFNKFFAANTDSKKDSDLFSAHKRAVKSGAMFDSRAFNIPREEATNYFYWRQLDASRNSIQMVGQAYFSHKELMRKSCNEIQDMVFTQIGVNWNDYETYKKRGSCVIKDEITGKWVVDRDIPIFKGESRQYIDRFVNIDGDL